MYCNVVYTDLTIKGLVRVFVSLQKENVVIFLFFKKKKKVFLAMQMMQMRHSRLRRLISPGKVFTIIFNSPAVIVHSSLVILCKVADTGS